jgi:hypothetical protein
MEPKYPEVKVKLVGEDGNAFNIIGLCNRAIAEAFAGDSDKIKKIKEEFQAEAMSGDYNHLLATAMDFFEVS